MSEERQGTGTRWARNALRTAFVLASPPVFYVLVSRLSPTAAALGVAGWILLRTAEPFLSASPSHRWDVVQIPLVGIAFSALSAVVGTPWILLIIPAALQFSLAFLFARSLRTGVPLVERFARLYVPNLPPDEVTYCRTLTWVWALYLACIGLVSVGFARFASPASWAIFTGVGSYGLVAVLFVIEYATRAVRFRHRYHGLAHCFFRRILP